MLSRDRLLVYPLESDFGHREDIKWAKWAKRIGGDSWGLFADYRSVQESLVIESLLIYFAIRSEYWKSFSNLRCFSLDLASSEFRTHSTVCSPNHWTSVTKVANTFPEISQLQWPLSVHLRLSNLVDLIERFDRVTWSDDLIGWLGRAIWLEFRRINLVNCVRRLLVKSLRRSLR